jgi:hypothetical protein
MSMPTTASFVPASALGWIVNLPGDTQVSPVGRAC